MKIGQDLRILMVSRRIAWGFLAIGAIASICPGQIQSLPANTPMDPFESPAEERVFQLPHPEGVLIAPPSMLSELLDHETWTWQVLPSGVMYRSYLAGPREPRFAGQWVYERTQGWLWDVTLGGRFGLVRYGNQNSAWPEGWQFDVEGATFPRLDWTTRDVLSADYRIGAPLTYRKGRWEAKFGYYHYCSHLGDEYILRYPGSVRVNYVRDAVVLGVGYRPVPALRFYGETSYAFYIDGGALPWDFQVGMDYSPVVQDTVLGAPFFAVNGRLRQEADFGGSLVAQAGWQWRGDHGQIFRVGAVYMNGQSDEAQFHQQHEEQIGAAMWYDF